MKRAKNHALCAVLIHGIFIKYILLLVGKVAL